MARKSSYEYEETAPKGEDTTCPWNDHGYRCGRRGVYSEATSGGPWYCREHWAARHGNHAVPVPPATDPLVGYGIGPKREDEAPREFQRRAMEYVRGRIGDIGRNAPSKEWARTVLDRWEDGGPVSDIAFRSACEVAGWNPAELMRIKQ